MYPEVHDRNVPFQSQTKEKDLFSVEGQERLLIAFPGFKYRPIYGQLTNFVRNSSLQGVSNLLTNSSSQERKVEWIGAGMPNNQPVSSTFFLPHFSAKVPA